MAAACFRMGSGLFASPVFALHHLFWRWGEMISPFCTNAQKNGMEPLRVTLAPGGRSMELKPSEAEEFGYVLKGAIRIIRGTKSYLVKSGESFYLKGLKRHHIEAYGVKEAVFIWVSTPPNF